MERPLLPLRRHLGGVSHPGASRPARQPRLCLRANSVPGPRHAICSCLYRRMASASAGLRARPNAHAAHAGSAAMNLSVLIPVYAQESPRFLGECLDSLAAQTRAADEVVIVEDGPLTEELHATIHYHARHLPVVRATLPRHAGLGEALRSGLE